MQQRVSEIFNKSKNELIWFLNHDHIYTQGTSATENEIIKKNEIRIVKTNRGGKTTYHGPGQRIVYFMIDLNNKKKISENLLQLLKNHLWIF